MSLVDQSLPPREAGRSERSERSYISSENKGPVYSAQERYRDSTIEDFFSMDHQDLMSPGQKTPQATMEPPPLPQKNARRASRLLDNLGLKLGGSIESHDLATTPHDAYLSSEEDASSSADEFSDYDWDSGSDDAQSPTRRRSHEDTARAVSVIFVGKPAIIELSPHRRSGSRGSGASRRVSCAETASTTSSWTRPSTSNASSTSLSVSSRNSSTVEPVHSLKRKPPFLNIDPFANGSTYSLELPKENTDDSQSKTPRTPTSLLKNAARTFSLVTKRSKPLLNSIATTPSRDIVVSPPRLERASTVPPELETKATETPQSPQSPVTYNDILRAARRNAKLASSSTQLDVIAASPVDQQSPTSPLSPGGSRKSFLGGFAARRRSIKMVNGRLL